MRRRLHECMAFLAEEAGLGCEMAEGACQGRLDVHGLGVHVRVVEESGMLVFYAAVGLVPLNDREELFRLLLTGNDALRETRGCALGVDMESDLVTMQLTWDMGTLDTASFADVAYHFCSVCADWLTKLDAWRPAPKSSGDELPIGGGGYFIPV